MPSTVGSAQVNRLAASIVAVLLAIIALAPSDAAADTLLLNATALAECPACSTPTGGAQVVNYLEQVAPQTLSFTPFDNATPPPEGWAVNATTMATDEAAMVVADGATAAAADTVVSATASAEVGAGAIPALCGTGFLCPAALAVGAFTTGYVIGTGAKSLYAQLFGGDDANTDSAITQLKWKRYTGTSDNYPASTPSGAVIHPGEFYMTYRQSFQDWSYSWTGSITSGQCHFGPRPPSNTIVRTGTTTIRCASGQPVQVYVRKPGMFFSHRRPLVPASSADTSGATTVAAPSAPPRTAFQDAASNALNDPLNHSFRLWVQHELDPRCSADPTKSVVNVPTISTGESTSAFMACLQHLGFATTLKTMPETDLDYGPDAPVMSSPGDEGTAAPGTTVTVYVNPPATQAKPHEDERCRPSDSVAAGDPGAAPPGYIGTDPVFQPRPDPALPGYAGTDLTASPPTARMIRLWWGNVPPGRNGWGYRHIMERHGYGPGDEAATAAALLDPSPEPVDPDGGTSWLFRSWYTATDSSGVSVNCVRVVLVNFFPRVTEPAPRDIITSYFGAVD